MKQAIVDVVTRADAWAQPRFDRVIHAVMRGLGVSKRWIRRNAWGVALIAMVGSGYKVGGEFSAWIAIGVAMVVVLMYADDKTDEASDGSPTVRSRADVNAVSRKVLGLAGLAIALFLIFTRPERPLVTSASDVMLQCVWLFQGYLCCTSPQAPQKKRERASALQWAVTK